MTNLELALSIFNSKADMARTLDLTPQNLTHWFNKGLIPCSYALKVQRVTNGRVKAMDVLLENELAGGE